MINNNSVAKLGYFLFSLMVVFTISMLIYSAQPWGDNYAYQKLSGYIFLLVVMVWAILPYVFLFYFLRYLHNRFVAIKIFTVSIFIISALSAALIINVNFFNIDAQGGLIYLFLPIYQWCAIILVSLVTIRVQKK